MVLLNLKRILKRNEKLSESFLVSDEFPFSLFNMAANFSCDGRCLAIFSVKTLMISVLFLLSSLRYLNWLLISLINDSLFLSSFANFSSDFFKIWSFSLKNAFRGCISIFWLSTLYIFLSSTISESQCFVVSKEVVNCIRLVGNSGILDWC